MKNNLKMVLVCFISLFLLPILVFADMGAPDIGNYDVVISNKSGASLYDYNYRVIGTIPYDTKITVHFEYTYNGIIYGSVTYNGKSGEIRLSDATIYQTEIDLSQFDKLDTPSQLYVFGEDAYLYNGPSVVYGRVSDGKNIPVGETVTYEYYSDAWVYVTYDGVEGWLLNYPYFKIYDDLNTSVAQVTSGDSKIMTIATITSLSVDPSQPEKTVSVTIPVGTEISYRYYYAAPNSEYVYIEYDGVKGWLYVVPSSYGEDTKNAAFNDECSTMIILSNQVYVYKKMGDINSKTTKTIPYGTEATIVYSFVKDGYSWNQIYYDKHYYWFAMQTEDSLSSYATSNGFLNVYKAKKELELYENPSKTSKKLEQTIKSGTVVDGLYSFTDESVKYSDDYSSWVYVEAGDIKGWAPYNFLEYVDMKEVCQPISKVEEEPNDTEEDDEEERTSEGLSPKLIAALAIGGAVVLALVIVVIIKLVNKKKNKQGA